MVTRLLRQLSFIKKVVLIAGVLVALYALLGFFVAPYFIKSTLSSRLSEQLDRPVSIREVRLNPFALSLTVGGLEVNEQDRNPLLGFDELYINVQVSSLINRALTFEEIRVKLPYGVLKIRRDGMVNLAQLGSQPSPGSKLPTERESAAQPPRGRRLPPIIIRSFEVEKGAIEFQDETKHAPFQSDVVPIHFSLKRFSTHQESDNALEFTAELGPGEAVSWQGRIVLEPLGSDGHIALSGLNLRSIWEYLQDQLPLELTDGVLDAKAAYHFERGTEGWQAVVSAGTVSLSRVALRERNAADTLISIPAITARGIEADLRRRSVVIDSVSSKDASIKGRFDQDGTVNYQRLFTQRPAADQRRKEAWSLMVKEVALENYTVMFKDQRPSVPAKFLLDEMTLHVRDFKTQPRMAATLELALRFNETGRLSSSGAIATDPVRADLDVTVSQLPFVPFQPYVDQLSQVKLADGAANLTGHVRYGRRSDGEPLLRYQGSAGITRFALVDKQAQDLLKWENLSLNALSVDVLPTRVAIGEISLQRPFARVMIGADKSFNITEALRKADSASDVAPQKPEPQPTDGKFPEDRKAPEPLPVTIDTVRIKGGSTQFADLSMEPQVSARIEELYGAIRGLSSKELARADVQLEGKIDKYAPVQIAGQINPLTSEAFTDISVLFRNIELTTLSPYAAKYAGYPITKGKLSLDLRYNLSKKHLDAHNRVRIDQLTLGEKTESPDATSLPVKLALAVMTDRKGQIDIELPVKGNLEDPDFRYGRLVLQALGNLATKAVTSPFSMLAGLVGGKEEDLSEVDFQSGMITLPIDRETPLKSLAKALEERPGLRLEIAGTADPAADRVALTEVKLRQDLDRLEQKGTSGGTARVAASGEGTLTDEGSLLRSLYQERLGRGEMRQSEGAGAKNAVTLKTELLQTYTVEDAELWRLAEGRAGQVRDHLLGFGGVKPEQVFLLEPKIEATAHQGLVPTKLVLAAQ